LLQRATTPVLTPGGQGRRGPQVKLIIATIKPFKLEEVREALTTVGVRA
jgi:nitrogen regulatory protein P-II 1